MSNRISSVVIVGGGTAGWITAGTIAARLRAGSRLGVSVTLIESPNIPIVGVGEGTWPTMRRTLKNMGIRETDLIRECNVSFKQGAKFAQWATGEAGDYYYHPLVLPQGFDDVNLVPHWLEDDDGTSFAEAVCPQERICERGLAPKKITTPEYAGVVNYAYHINAGTFSEFLRKHCVDTLGVRHIVDDVTGINSKDNGDIASVTCKVEGNVAGDLFVDCTGFQSLLLGRHYGVPFVSRRDVLFADTALAVQVPYPNDDTAIVSHTVATAQEAGWIWDIGLSTRRGVGYVFSSAHTSEQRAMKRLMDYLRPSTEHPEALDARTIPIDPGHRQRFWERNCVAIGLSAGFLEPLEASALLLVETSAWMVAEQFPVTREAMDVIAKRFNRSFRYRWDRIIDFLKLHYLLSSRTDNEFWIDNRDPSSVPESLRELVELWRYQSPWQGDFDQAAEVFPAASYQYVLYGMGFRTEPSHLGQSELSRRAAHELFRENQVRTEQMLAALPTNRELLHKVYEHGLQTV